MKKTLFAILALAAVACNKADVIDSNPGEAIQFGNAFVDNATKVDPSYSANDIESRKMSSSILVLLLLEMRLHMVQHGLAQLLSIGFLERIIRSLVS